MSSNMKLNWANSSPIKPWNPHGRKMSILSLKSKIFSILNTCAMFPSVIWAFEANGTIGLLFGATIQKLWLYQ
jgi:hypothetical protein